jgi:hypothetical protein
MFSIGRACQYVKYSAAAVDPPRYLPPRPVSDLRISCLELIFST